MYYLLPQMLRYGWSALFCSKRCNYIKQGVLSKRIQPNLVKILPNLVTLIPVTWKKMCTVEDPEKTLCSGILHGVE